MSNELNTLQSLTDTAIDSAMGYRKASEAAKTQHLKDVLREQASKREALIERLNAEIVRLGGTARTDGSALGAAHRAWTSFTDAFSSGDKAASERVEEGEDHLEEKFREALDKGTFDAQTRQLLVSAHGEIAEGERLTDRLEEQYD